MSRSALTPPLLVGVVDSAPALVAQAAGGPGAPAVDLVEARVDLFDEAERAVDVWGPACARLEAAGTPVLVTVRLASEGGRWTAPEPERLALYREALAYASWVDVEAQSPIAGEVATLARRAGRTAVLSHHDFVRTPPLDDLLRVVDGCRAAGAAVAKVATMVRSDADRETLFSLLDQRPDAMCVIGMGAAALDLRVLLPARGSLLAYGYISRPTAPGQISVIELDRRLRAASPAYVARRTT
jgi:3-dehydroquinate dehydratase-1